MRALGVSSFSCFYFLPIYIGLLSLSVTLSAQSITQISNLDSLLNLINRLQENSNYRASIPYCLEMIQKTSGLADRQSLKYNIKAQLFLIEAYRDQHYTSLYEAKVMELRNSIHPADDRLQISNIEISKQFASIIFYADLLVLKNKYNEAIEELNKGLQFVLLHPEFYGAKYLKDSMDSKDHRLYQCYNRLSKIALYENNFTLAQQHLNVALKHARMADQAVAKALKPPQGHEEKCLIDLIDLTLKSKNERFINYYRNAYNEMKKAGAYGQNKTLDYSFNLLNNANLTKEEGLTLIAEINKNPLAINNLSIQFKVIAFYLKYRLTIQTKILLDKIKPLIRYDNHKASWFLAQAGHTHNLSEFRTMSGYIDSSLFYLTKNKSTQGIWQDKGLRTQLLETIQTGILYYNNGYEQSGDTVFLSRNINLILKFVSGLTSIRNDLMADEDRLSMIQRLTPVINLALKTFSQVPQHHKLDFDLILACFEAGKSFNLYSTSVLKRKMNDIDLKKYNQLTAEKQELQNQFELEEINLDSLQNLLIRNQSELNEIASDYIHQTRFQFKTIREVQARLDNHTSVLEYFKGQNNIFGLLINKTKTQLLHLPIADSLIKQDIDNLKLSMFLANQSAYKALRDSLYQTAAWRLYLTLIKPIDTLILHKVVIIPDHNLSQVPFTALLTKPTQHPNPVEWPYWIYQHIISTQYSLSIWLRENEVLDQKRSFDKSLISFAPHFDDLKFNLSECKALSNFMGNTMEFLGEQADVNNFKRFAYQGRILHLASHARSDENKQDQSFIRLSRDTIFANDISKLNLPQELVFLSACETGTGKIISGEGMMSLARSFFQAGAQCVISTLWRIRDDISKEQVIQIYKGLKQGKTKDEAIRDMQIKYLSEAKQDEAFPANWAAYQSQGNPDPLFPHPVHAMFYFMGLISIIALTIGSLIYLRYRNKENLKLAA